jgi:hypothetical protein
MNDYMEKALTKTMNRRPSGHMSVGEAGVLTIKLLNGKIPYYWHG